MTEIRDNHFETPRGTFSLWTGILAGPLLWFVNQSANFALTPWACRTQHVAVLHLVAFACLAGTLVAGEIARRNARWTNTRWRESCTNALQRGRFMAQLGVLSSLLFAIVIIAMALPNFLVDPCAR